MKKKETNFVGRKTWKFKVAVRKSEIARTQGPASKVKMNGSKK